VYLCSFYRPPNNEPHPIAQLSDSLVKVYQSEPNFPAIVLGGDFNLPGITWDDGLGQVNPNPAYGLEVNDLLIDILNDNHLEQLVTYPTCGNNILDLLFCTSPAFITNVQVVPGISDHEAIIFNFTSQCSLPLDEYNHSIPQA